MRTRLCLLLTLLMFALSAFAEEGPGDARKHMIRGIAAIEMAKSNAELALAADEFRRATELDPAMSSAWYNLGSVQSKLGRFNEAIASYRQYLVLVPNAEDAQKVEDEIIKLEFRQEMVGKAKSRGGKWIGPSGAIYELKVEGNRLTLTTDQHPVSDNEATESYTLVGSIPITQPEKLHFQLELNGNQITGTWMHSAIKADQCTIPEERGDVTGEVNDADKSIVLRYTRTKYHAPVIMAIFPGDYCGGVEAVERKEVTMTFHGPVPAGVPRDFIIAGLSRELGAFVKVGWFGRIRAANVIEGSPVFAAGLRKDDEILAIDGTEVKSLSAGETFWRMFGEVGSEIRLTVQHENSKEPVTLTIRRTQWPGY